MVYIIKLGDTLTQIAKKHDLTLQKLLSYNPKITDPNYIYAEDRLVIADVSLLKSKLMKRRKSNAKSRVRSC